MSSVWRPSLDTYRTKISVQGMQAFLVCRHCGTRFAVLGAGDVTCTSCRCVYRVVLTAYEVEVASLYDRVRVGVVTTDEARQEIGLSPVPVEVADGG